MEYSIQFIEFKVKVSSDFHHHHHESNESCRLLKLIHYKTCNLPLCCCELLGLEVQHCHCHRQDDVDGVDVDRDDPTLWCPLTTDSVVMRSTDTPTLPTLCTTADTHSIVLSLSCCCCCEAALLLDSRQHNVMSRHVCTCQVIIFRT